MSDNQMDGMPRRTFLLTAAGSAGLLMPGTLRFAGAALPNLFDDDASQRLRIGYLAGSDRIPSFADLTHSTRGFVDACNQHVDHESCTELLQTPIVEADRVASGDPGFVQHGARLRVHGMYHTHGARADKVPGVQMYAHMQPFHAIPFQIWGLDHNDTHGGSAANGVCVPIAKRDGLTVSFAVRGANDPRPSTDLTPLNPAFCDDHLVARFSVGHEAGTPKLRRGLYFVSFGNDAQSRPPSWRRRRVEVAQIDADKNVEQGGVLCSRMAEPEMSFARPISYVLMSIDYDRTDLVIDESDSNSSSGMASEVKAGIPAHDRSGEA